MRTSIEWDTSWCIGVAPIDVQHRRLVALLQDLNRSRAGVPASTSSVNLLIALADYIELHFGDEEAFMVLIDYPNLEAHRAQHASFIQRVQALSMNYRSGQIELTRDVIAFLSEWILEHIAVSDALIARFVRTHGIGLPPSLTHQPVATKAQR